MSNFDTFVISMVIVEKMCGPTAMGTKPDRARLCAANELPTCLNLVESNKDQTLGGRVWIRFKFLVW